MGQKWLRLKPLSLLGTTSASLRCLGPLPLSALVWEPGYPFSRSLSFLSSSRPHSPLPHCSALTVQEPLPDNLTASAHSCPKLPRGTAGTQSTPHLQFHSFFFLDVPTQDNPDPASPFICSFSGSCPTCCFPGSTHCFNSPAYPEIQLHSFHNSFTKLLRSVAYSDSAPLCSASFAPLLHF